jgi:hypothetical protein
MKSNKFEFHGHKLSKKNKPINKQRQKPQTHDSKQKKPKEKRKKKNYLEILVLTKKRRRKIQKRNNGFSTSILVQTKRKINPNPTPRNFGLNKEAERKFCEERPARGGWRWLGENRAEFGQERKRVERDERREMRGGGSRVFWKMVYGNFFS